MEPALASLVSVAGLDKREKGLSMTYVITEPCIGLKDASCVAVCPVDCIYTTDDAEQ